jgi:hypothetical protein
MSNRIPKNLTKAHILQAINKIDREGLPEMYQSRHYVLKYENNPHTRVGARHELLTYWGA